MSESLRRKSSSRQLLQNLISVTAQRSQEDAEEVERERRRRSRETQRGERSPASWPESPQCNELAHNTPLDEELKPRCCLVLEEDEGFSDWSHRLENRGEPEVQRNSGAGLQRPSTQRWKPRPEEEKRQEGEEEDDEDEEEKGCEAGRSSRSQEASTRPPEMSIDRKEVKMSYSSTVFLSHDARLQNAAGQPDRTSYLVAGTMRPRGKACQVDREEQQQEEQQEEEEEDEKEEEEEEDHGMPDKSLARSSSRRSEEVNRGAEGEEPLNYGPMSPTFKKLLIQFYPEEVNNKVSTDTKCSIIERTESLRKSTGNVKKTLPPVAVSKIDRKLELYTHALELSSQEGRSGTQALTDLTSLTEPISSKKSLFEAGEAWSQNDVRGTPSKVHEPRLVMHDPLMNYSSLLLIFHVRNLYVARSNVSSSLAQETDGLRVGVANLINQWVKGSEDGSRCSSPSRPAESSSAKRYKFVVTGHGKYEKVSEDCDCSKKLTARQLDTSPKTCETHAGL